MLSRIQKYFSLSGTLTVLLLCYNMNTGKAQVYAEEGFMGGDTLAISGFTDGPHVEWKDLKNFEAMNFLYTDSLDLVSMSITAGRLKKGSRYLAGPNITPRKYRIDKDIQAGPQIIKTDQQIFVVGDVHGEYTKLIKLLRISGIINSSNNWSWGKGQLVFLGDLMDRGAQVTETLWFVKKIQYQAAKEGGGVHVILGNHEIMNLTGDHRYINRKYRLLSEKLGVDYFNFYEKNMELGRWIRSFNSIIRINDNLFVHGGISPELLEKQLSMDSINHLVQKYLDRDFKKETNEIMFFLTDNKGPFWYRGFLYATPEYPKLTDKKLDEILEFYEASRIIFGHSENPVFQISTDQRLFGIDIPLRLDLGNEKALLIDGDQFYKVFSDGSKELIE